MGTRAEPPNTCRAAQSETTPFEKIPRALILNEVKVRPTSMLITDSSTARPTNRIRDPEARGSIDHSAGVRHCQKC